MAKKKSLKIGIIVTGHFTIPPPKGIIYAPMLIAQAVAEGMVKKGHKVYFFTPEGSKLKVTKLVSGNLKPLRGISGKKDPKILSGPHVGGIEVNKIFNLWDQYFVALMYRAASKEKLDILHVHPIDRALPFGLAFPKIPVVYTLHDPTYPWRAEIYKIFSSKNQYLVSISNAQRKPAPKLNYAATVYNGIDLKLFPFYEKSEDHLLFLGRLLETKGPDIAIQAALRAKEKLIIAGIPNQGNYWDTKIKPYLNKDIQYVGNVPYHLTHKYYGGAKALLCPIQWEEPFGLTFTEAMACGTPVIAYKRGSVPEVINHGKTGFVVENLAQMVGAIKKINLIDRKNCRIWVEKKFGLKTMVDNYEKVFLRLAKKHGAPHPRN